MQKMAIFVEGRTEQLFTSKLLSEIATNNKLVIEEKRAVGRQGTRKLTLLTVSNQTSASQYLVTIINCEGDSSVKSDIRDQYDNLISSGYEAIIGLRDAYPTVKRLADIKKLRDGLRFRVKTQPVRVLFVLSIMEIEAWFLAEYEHLRKIDGKLTVPFIKKRIGLDLINDDLQIRPNPAGDLNRIYRLAGRAYEKEEKQVRRTVNALDYSAIYLTMSGKIFDIGNLCTAIDEFVA